MGLVNKRVMRPASAAAIMCRPGPSGLLVGSSFCSWDLIASKLLFVLFVCYGTGNSFSSPSNERITKRERVDRNLQEKVGAPSAAGGDYAQRDASVQTVEEAAVSCHRGQHVGQSTVVVSPNARANQTATAHLYSVAPRPLCNLDSKISG